MKNHRKHKIVVGISGASGAIYAKLLLDQLKLLQDQIDALVIVMSDNAKYVWETELGNRDFEQYPFTFYKKTDFEAPFASGSAKYNCMIIAPCSMGTLSRIAAGTSNDLMTRAADVILKERRQLILVCRESPLNLIHIENMRQLTLAGGIICPAIPSFYSKPQTIEEAVMTVINRVIDLSGLDKSSYSWGETE